MTINKYASISDDLVERILKDRVKGGEFSVFEFELHGVPYQFVSRLLYDDPFHEQLAGGLGFTVNLQWVRRLYFPELTKQVGRIGGTREGLHDTLLDMTEEKTIVVMDAWG